MIAIILLVAITVVLAAVLYVLIASTLSGGNTTIPLGTALALGPATPLSGSGVATSYCQMGQGCYQVAIASASHSLDLGDLDFTLKNASGTLQTVGAGTGQFSFVNGSGGIIAQSSPIPAGSPLVVTTWTFASGYSINTLVTSQLSIWIEFGTAIPNPAGHGFVLQALGTGPFHGVVTLPLP